MMFCSPLQLQTHEREVEELQGEVEAGRQRDMRREGEKEREEGEREAELERLQASLSLVGVEREKMELKLASQEETISALRQEVRRLAGFF